MITYKFTCDKCKQTWDVPQPSFQLGGWPIQPVAIRLQISPANTSIQQPHYGKAEAVVWCRPCALAKGLVQKHNGDKTDLPTPPIEPTLEQKFEEILRSMGVVFQNDLPSQ